VVDDQETSCSILKSILESWQLQVDTALSAEAGLEKILAAEQADTPFGLLLLDWKLGGMSGLALAHEVGLKESQGKLKHHPVIIMVTAYSKEQLLAEMSNTSTHLDTILTKPVVPSSLLNAILHVYHYKNNPIHQAPKNQISPYELARPLRNIRVLLVEDNDLNQQVASEFLEKSGLRVSIANHGGEAVQWLQKTDFDVVLMDLQMPEMDGYEATRRIRQLPNCQHLPIIAMTAAAMENDREACLAAGMNDHVAKPIQPLDLINALLRWVKPVVAEPFLSTSTNKATWDNLADKLPGFDLENIMTMLGNDQEKLIRILIDLRKKFIHQVPVIVHKITAGELGIAEEYLHTLKGTAGNLGARELYQASAKLDAELINGMYEPETLAQWLEIFHKTMDSIAALTRQFQPVPRVSSANNMSLQQVMAELDSRLANDDFISDELLMQLKKRLPDEQQAEYDTLNQFIMNTDYANARFILNSLRGLPNEHR
jgi:CheY-like chemotaxis protein/HPt (histidine-containing phosphotransfer) domain-containing protein